MRLMVLLIVTFAMAAAQAQPVEGPAAEAWRSLARVDAEAALTLIEENHPGAEPSLGDATFRERLAAARAHVAERLPQVRDHFGHAALLQGLAADFRDGHVRSNPILQLPYRAWAGIVLKRQAGAWLVGAQERREGEPDLVGHRLVACDGREAESWAAERIGLFRGDPGVEAQLAVGAASLLIRDGNPFLERVRACTFEAPGGGRSEVALSWRQTSVSELEPVLARVGARPRAGMGVSPFAGGYWIALETLGPSAAEVVGAVEAQAEALRSAPMVVLDLRGNSGGNSAYAGSIAAALVGRERAQAADPPMPACGGAYWRATPANLEAMRSFRAQMAERISPAQLAQVDREIEAVEQSIAAGRAFGPDLPDCARGPVPERSDPRSLEDAPPSAYPGRLVLVTDRTCFSSCLIAVDMFRRLGAVQVGEATDSGNRYMEVRETLLPSGIRTFATLQKVVVGFLDLGPFVPDRVYPGDLADTEALKAWVAALPPEI